MAAQPAVAVPPPPRSRTHAFVLEQPAASAIEWFTALGERDWAPGWAPELVSGHEARGSVFATTSAEGVLTHWIVVAFDRRAGHASYARLAHGSHMGLVDVHCRALGAARTEVSVTYTLTPLSDDGERFVAEMLEPARYRAFVDGWKAAIDAAISS
ncbi:MAG TPA: hypothetical protein VFL14_10645 [Xanthomonadales bacterium]|nr:hypothetical protein [Xanthomonadales bacterium]